ncbi:MAG: DUF6522 family protein [Roseovarius sp.]|nr:DUF6522 family protein [Roseovarius sp.]
MSDTAIRRRIRATPSLNDPATMRFILDDPVAPGRSAGFDRADDTTAPLARALFDIDGVQRVHVAEATIHVTLADSAEWADRKAPVAQAIRDALDAGGDPLGPAGGRDTGTPRDDAALRAAVADLLDKQANPAIAAHGGHVAVERVTDAVAYLRMSGGCQGCAASAATLRDGIENMLRAALPELRDIVDLTDHEAGTNPYYSADTGQSPVLSRPVPASAVHWDGEDLSIDPAYLAPKLGLTPEVLVAGLGNGDIHRELDEGTGADGTSSRLTIRTPARAWAAEIAADGTLREVPPPTATPARPAVPDPELVHRVRHHLMMLPPDRRPVTYGQLARAMGFYLPGAVRRITAALEATMHEDAAARRPFVASLVVARGTGLPGRGFFDLARQLGQPVVADEATMAAYRDSVYGSVAERG